MKKFWIVAALLLPPALALAAALDLDAVAGVYKYDFPNAAMDGTKYNSENVLEVVKVSPTQAYMRTHLEFANGHVCNLAVVAKAEGDALVWRAKNMQGQPCQLSLHFAGGKVTFDDKNDACRVDSCGARGIYTGSSFTAASRRPIRYMPRLLASSQYADAIKAAGQ